MSLSYLCAVLLEPLVGGPILTMPDLKPGDKRYLRSADNSSVSEILMLGVIKPRNWVILHADGTVRAASWPKVARRCSTTPPTDLPLRRIDQRAVDTLDMDQVPE